MAKKTKTEFSMACQHCGAKMPIYALKNGRFMAQCFGCGQIMFGPGPLLERLKYGDTVCPHKPELKPCKGGSTTWCPLCRVRAFVYSGVVDPRLGSRGSAPI
jgi:hypothetical protein